MPNKPHFCKLWQILFHSLVFPKKFLTTKRALCGLENEIMHSEWSKIMFFPSAFDSFKALYI